MALKNGYVYIYVSNESPVNVFFDNLQVVHTRGAILEETHYYPFGLIQSGISSKALSFGSPENKRKYNGIEYENSFDINIGETFFRSHDPQLGRWWQIDPKIEKGMENWGPYNGMFDNPVRFLDPMGDSSKPQQAYIPAPKTLPGFPEAGKREFNKESDRYRWKLKDGSILEWDKQKGEIEKFDKSGKKHQGAFDPNTGQQIKDPVAGRTTPKFGPVANPEMWKPNLTPWKNESASNGVSIPVTPPVTSLPHVEESAVSAQSGPRFRFGLLGVAIQAAINKLSEDPVLQKNEREYY